MPTRSEQPPCPEFIPLAVPHLGGNEWLYARECLDSGWVSSVGPFVERFERMVAAQAGTAQAVAIVNGTAALHVALQVAGVQPGEEVVVSTLSFIAPANAIRYCGGFPVFMDAEPQTWQMDVPQAVSFLERGCRWDRGELRNRATGRRVRALLPVHILGGCVDIDPLKEAAARYGLAVVEDAAEALGATYKSQPAGHLGDIGCFSFNGNKVVTTGGGGMIVTDRVDWAERARFLTTQAKSDPLEYVHSEVGYNYRLTALQAALGCAQMEQLPSFLEAKRRIAAIYSEALAGIPGLTAMPIIPGQDSAFWLYTVLIDPRVFGRDSRSVLSNLAALGIQTRPLWQPLHLSPAHRDACCPAPCPIAERLYQTALSLPCSTHLTEASQQRVIESLRALAA